MLHSQTITENKWQFCMEAFQRNKFPQALILYGMIEPQLEQFTHDLAQFLLCEQKSAEHFCNQCLSCRWYTQHSHPDLISIIADKQIKIDDIRMLQQALEQTFVRQHRIVIINSLDKMNLAASHAFLKILEEPSPDVYFLLLSEQFNQLMPTIKSRCTMISLPCHQEEHPLRVIFMDKLEKLYAKQVSLLELSQWCVGQDCSKLLLQWLSEWLKKQILAQPKFSRLWFEHYDSVVETQSLLQQKINLNQDLLFEHLFARIILDLY